MITQDEYKKYPYVISYIRRYPEYRYYIYEDENPYVVEIVRMFHKYYEINVLFVRHDGSMTEISHRNISIDFHDNDIYYILSLANPPTWVKRLYKSGIYWDLMRKLRDWINQEI